MADDDLPDLELKSLGSNLLRVTATSERAVALLRSLIAPDDQPTEDADGSEFIVLPIECLEDVIRRSEQAGFTLEHIEVPKPRLSS
jgi:hypothetical protein